MRHPQRNRTRKRAKSWIMQLDNKETGDGSLSPFSIAIKGDRESSPVSLKRCQKNRPRDTEEPPPVSSCMV